MPKMILEFSDINKKEFVECAEKALCCIKKMIACVDKNSELAKEEEIKEIETSTEEIKEENADQEKAKEDNNTWLVFK